MNLEESFRVALESIWANKMRSFLTMLGIVIGVAAVIAVVAIAQGGQSMILGEIEGLGSNLLWVFPKSLNESLNWERIQWLEDKDIKALERAVPSIENLSPENMRVLTMRAGAESGSFSVSGVSHSYHEVRSLRIGQGRFFTRDEIEGARRVAVLASDVPEKLFNRSDVLGEVFYVEGLRFVIVGILDKVEGGMLGDPRAGEYVFLPYTTLNRMLGEKRVDVLYLQVKTSADVAHCKEEVMEVLDRRFGEDKFAIQSLEEFIAVAQNVMGIMTKVVAGIAGVALLVGGIGIMNIMLVSVTERTREIGIRKALGARRRDLLYQFLVESTVLSGVGGLAGILMGGILVTLVSKVAGLPSLISVQSVALAFLFSAGVGILFGVYPASKAAKLDPIEALRYE